MKLLKFQLAIIMKMIHHLFVNSFQFSKKLNLLLVLRYLQHFFSIIKSPRSQPSRAFCGGLLYHTKNHRGTTTVFSNITRRLNYTIPRTTGELQPNLSAVNQQSNYTIPRTTGELQPLTYNDDNLPNYTIPRTTGELQLSIPRTL